MAGEAEGPVNTYSYYLLVLMLLFLGIQLEPPPRHNNVDANKGTWKSLALSSKRIPMTPKKVCTAAPRQTSTSPVGADASTLACFNETCRAAKEQIQVQQTISH